MSEDTIRPFVAVTGRKAGRPKGRKGNGPPESPGSGRPAKLQAEDMTIALRLQGAGKSYRQIAEVLSTPDRPVSASTLAKWLARARTPNEEIAATLASYRHEAIDTWRTAMRTGSRYGKHAPSRDLLQATGAIARDEHVDRITIVVGDGSVAVGRLPASLRTIDVTPVRESDPDA